MQSVKVKSSKWVNESRLTPDRFEWQRGFGAFSYSKSATKNVYNYIANQEAHHHKETFKIEYAKFLDALEVEYDEDYYFEELIWFSLKSFNLFVIQTFKKNIHSL
jgi:hypothetical protein